MPTIPIRDTTLYYESTGEGPTLLFVHGMCGDANVWAGQVRRLADRFRCVAYDRRGHSRSAPGRGPDSVPTHAEDAAALIAALRVRPIVVGSSGGARIAVELTRRHPDLVSGAVFSEPPIFSLDPAGAALVAELGAVVGPVAAREGPRAAVDAFFALLCPGLWSTLDEAGRDRYRANAPTMLAEFAGPRYALGAADLAGIGVPALVIAGTTSHPALRAIAAVLARGLPDARFVEFAGCGHVTYAERPAEFAAAVAAFATELAGAARA